jgi:hypothetical protein
VLLYHSQQYVTEPFTKNRKKLVTGWRRQYNGELPNLYASLNVIKVSKSRCMRWARHVAFMAEIRNRHKMLVRRPEGKGLLERPKHTSEYQNIS